jgi:hypothetical protein
MVLASWKYGYTLVHNRVLVQTCHDRNRMVKRRTRRWTRGIERRTRRIKRRAKRRTQDRRPQYYSFLVQVAANDDIVWASIRRRPVDAQCSLEKKGQNTTRRTEGNCVAALTERRSTKFKRGKQGRRRYTVTAVDCYMFSYRNVRSDRRDRGAHRGLHALSLVKFFAVAHCWLFVLFGRIVFCISYTWIVISVKMAIRANLVDTA